MKLGLLFRKTVAFIIVLTLPAVTGAEVSLKVDRYSGEMFLQNDGVEVIAIAGYELSDTAANLRPSTWRGISDAVRENSDEVVTELGEGAREFKKPKNSRSILAELNPVGSLSLSPEKRWSLGYPLGADADVLLQKLPKVQFAYTVVTNQDTEVRYQWRAGTVAFSNCEGLPRTPSRELAGDVNHDGCFNSSDMVQVFSIGKFETCQFATYDEGDWNGDGVFNSSDLVLAFQRGTYEECS